MASYQQGQEVQYIATKPGVPAYQGDSERAQLLGAEAEYQGERFKPDNSWRDLPFLVVFIIQFLGLGALCFVSIC